MTREKTARLVQRPSRAMELAVVFDLNLQVTFIVGELARTFTVPLPLQLPASVFKNMDSSDRAAPTMAAEVTAIETQAKRIFFITTTFR